MPFIDLQAVINGTDGYAEFDESTPLSFVAITSQNLNQINNDFNGIDGNEQSLGTPYAGVGEPGDEDYSPGAGSRPYSPYSDKPLDAVPEPAGYGMLIGLSALCAALCSRAFGRRRQVR